MFQPLTGGDIAKHFPVFDSDEDTHSNFPRLRGHHWRGRDCDDTAPGIHPGVFQNQFDPSVDHNCNGVHGTDGSGVAYEDRFCKNSGARGTVILGDSAAAHFHLPPSYLDAATITNTTYSGLLDLAMDELDFPHCSWATGHTYQGQDQTKVCPPSKLPFKSIYQRMVERNRCNHRDYQNIAVNGARSSSMANKIVNSFRRNPGDAPAIVFHALIGNDVCNSRHNFESMTSPAEFEANVLKTLQYLEETLAPESHVVFFPLADGRVLYDTMGQRTHVGGFLYSEFYDYLNCLQTSPCWGWLNTNATVREKTTAHAKTLNAVYPKIIQEQSQNFRKFKMYYHDFDWEAIFEDWIQDGNDPVDLIEPTDGFHPSTTANQLIAAKIWEWLESTHPEVIGKPNPYNSDIQRLFGDQGGH